MTESVTAAIDGLSGLGLGIMIVSLAGVVILLIWCYAKILTAPPPPDHDDE